MANNLHVTLRPTTTPRDLDVNETGNANEVKQDTKPQDIVWQLTGNAASGSFVSVSGSNPGFEWVKPVPPAGIFGAPTLSPNGNQLTISDTNDRPCTPSDPGTTGTFDYMLRAEVDGTVYSTIATLTRGKVTTTHPVIINK